jgi:hypothetical protein
VVSSRGRLLLAFSAGLSVALGTHSAVAALIVAPITSELPAWATTQSTTSSGPSPAHSQDKDEKDRPTLEIAYGLISQPATTGNCNSLPQSSGGEWNGWALAGAMWNVPPVGPRTSLPKEARTILPARVPFGLLRPV